METKIINEFKSWWGKFAEDRAISFCSKWCSGWNPELRSHHVTDDQKLEGRRGSVSALLLICFTWAFPSDHTQGIEPGESLLFHMMTVWLFFCYAFLSLKLVTEVFIYFYLYAFPHLPSPYHVDDLNVSVNLSLTALQNGRETAQSPFTRGSSPREEPAGLGRALRDWQLPSSSPHSVWYPKEMAMQCLAMPALPLPALPELAASGLHPVLMTKAQWDRKIKPLSVAKPSSP